MIKVTFKAAVKIDTPDGLSAREALKYAENSVREAMREQFQEVTKLDMYELLPTKGE